jgi:hypothetical protein
VRRPVSAACSTAAITRCSATATLFRRSARRQLGYRPFRSLRASISDFPVASPGEARSCTITTRTRRSCRSPAVGVAWNEGPEYEFVDVGPCDVVSFPPGVDRRFVNVTEGEPDTEHLLLFVVGGNGPQAEFTPDATRSCAAAVTACPRRPSRVRATDLVAAITLPPRDPLSLC